MAERRASSREVGRVRVLQLAAPPLHETPVLPEGFALDLVDVDGVVRLEAVDVGGRVLGGVRVHVGHHGDAFYGRYSATDATHVYGSKLEVDEAARGRGLGTALLRAARAVAGERTGLGLKSLVDPTNATSLHLHDAAGFPPASLELLGVRVGPRVLWLRRRPR